jgi:hypothetical protein
MKAENHDVEGFMRYGLASADEDRLNSVCDDGLSHLSSMSPCTYFMMAIHNSHFYLIHNTG